MKPAILRPYFAPEAPPARLNNSGRLGDLIRAGTLYLTAQDAIALALEDNIDLESARYNPLIAAWNLERSQAGGALPGVPSAAGFADRSPAARAWRAARPRRESEVARRRRRRWRRERDHLADWSDRADA